MPNQKKGPEPDTKSNWDLRQMNLRPGAEIYLQAFLNQLGGPDRSWARRNRSETSQPVNRRGTLYSGSKYGSVSTNALTNGMVDPSKSGVAMATSVAPTANEGFSYTCTDSSITWFYDGTNNSTLPKVRLADKTFVGLAPGSLAITGLAASTDYYFFPFYSVSNPCKAVSWVVGATAIGSPKIAFATVGNVEAVHLQNLQNRIALSSGGMKATTAAASSTSSGSAGGSDGGYLRTVGCPRVGQLVRSFTRGLIPVEQAHVGEKIESPFGWETVTHIHMESEPEFISFQTEDGDEAEISPSTPQYLVDGTRKLATDLEIGDEIQTRPGYSGVLRSVEIVSEPDTKVVLTCEPNHVFYCSWQMPNIVQCNVITKA